MDSPLLVFMRELDSFLDSRSPSGQVSFGAYLYHQVDESILHSMATTRHYDGILHLFRTLWPDEQP